MKIETRAVHSGDRKKAGPQIPVTTPIHTAASYFYDTTEQLDKVFGFEMPGYAYQRYDNPTNSALEEVLTSLEGGHGSLATASGMAALEIALRIATQTRPHVILAADALYGATIKLLHQVLEPLGFAVRFADFCDLAAVERAIAETRPGCLLLETISNPLLRVAPVDTIAQLARAAGAALVVDNTFATPLLVRPLELGAHFSVHSLTKYLSGHGDVLGGSVTCDAEHYDPLRAMGRVAGPLLGPFEAYLAMRGIKTFPLRMQRQCANAVRVAQWLAAHPRVERVFFPAGPAHPDAEVIRRLLPAGQFGAMVSFEIRGASRLDVFSFMDRLKMIVRATSLGDVHSMLLYPWMSSHRDVPPEQKARVGIRENLVRLSVGIEAPEDILSDLDHAIR
ncbi:MAG: PLP-dependent transferase [Acidobacteria bacterium]|nr:PLP-dependent transferase [Acidobacteriota bacterium]